MTKLTLPTFFKDFMLEFASRTPAERTDFIKDNHRYITKESLSETVTVRAGQPVGEVQLPLSHALAIAELLFEVKDIDKLLTQEAIELNRPNKELNLLNVYATKGKLEKVVDKGSITKILGTIVKGARGLKLQNKTIRDWNSPLYSYINAKTWNNQKVDPLVIKALKTKHWTEKNFEDFLELVNHIEWEENLTNHSETYNIIKLKEIAQIAQKKVKLKQEAAIEL